MQLHYPSWPLARGSVSSDTETPGRWFRFSLKTLLLLFIPVALLSAIAKQYLWSRPIDVAMSVERFSSYEAINGRTGLAAEVMITNKSRHTVWYMQNPSWYMVQRVDGQWLESLVSCDNTNPDEDWWSPLGGTQSTTILTGPIREDATAMKVCVAFTTDQFLPKRHWVSSPEIRIVRKGQECYAETDDAQDATRCPGDLAAYLNRRTVEIRRNQ